MTRSFIVSEYLYKVQNLGWLRVFHSVELLPSNSKLPRVRRASVMLPTSLASGMFVRLGEANWWARPLGMPGWRSGLCINTRDSIFSRPSWMSFFSWGIWRLRSYSTAVSAGLHERDTTDRSSSPSMSLLSVTRTLSRTVSLAKPFCPTWGLRPAWAPAAPWCLVGCWAP